MKSKTKIIIHSAKNKESFYSIFKDELPTFHTDDSVAWVVGECLHAAKRAEIKILGDEAN